MDAVTLIHAHDNYGARRDQAANSALGVDPLRLDLHLPPGPGHACPGTRSRHFVMRSLAPVILEVHPPYRPRVAELHDTGSLLFATC